MPPINTSKLGRMEKCTPKAVFIEGLAIVLKLLSNIIKDPANPKYRSFKLENKTIKEKVLCISGMKEFLLELGFAESSGSLNLGANVLINDLRINRDLIQEKHDSLQKNAVPVAQVVEVTPQPGPSKPVIPNRPTFHGKYSGTRKLNLESSSHPFLANIDGILRQVLSYEDKALQEFGRSLIPVEKLREETLERMQKVQKASRTDPIYEDLFIVVFTEWFNRSFFTWVNKVPCKVCGSVLGTRQNSYVQNGVRVEEIFCCNQPSKFYRYNDIATLLVTRKGRCGEYANCFTFLCRCLGYDARYIFATFDHVWTEIYSPFQMRWIHVDPSDAVIDSPLMYQHGWKRPCDYVLAFSQHDVTDVTWRYCNDDRQELLKRRTRCSQAALEAKLLAIYKELQRELSQKKREYLKRRMLLDSIAMFPIREPTDDERKGRSSGDLQWREMRGESAVDAFYVFNLSDEEAARKEFNLRYSAASDVYETFVRGSSGEVKILDTSKSWNSRVFSAKNVLRKEEHDWKMVYLARNEDTNEAVIEWKVDVTARKLSIKDVQLKFDTKVYEGATVKLEFVINKGEMVTNVQKVKNSAVVIIRATLAGGKGDSSWQHSQLFRQEMKSKDYPFELCLTFN